MKLDKKTEINPLASVIHEARLRLLKLHYTSQHGHLGGNLSCIDSLTVLYNSVLKKEDQFILSKGHAAGALYVALWSCGILNEDDLNTFTKDSTKLSAHPPVKGLKSVLFGTGSLGHGPSIASGLALSKLIKKEKGHVFCLCGDGEWQEGSCWEALIFAVHQKLNNLTILVDVNKWQGFGSTQEVASITLEKLKRQFEAFGAYVLICDGHDVNDLEKILSSPSHTTSPKVILMDTFKGKGLSFFEDTLACHYIPLTKEQYDIGLAELEVEHAK
jgi:transketolase